MKPGNAYLIHCGDWHTFVGRLVGQSTPLLWEFQSVSKITETNNADCWHAMAAGDEELRSAASYEHYKTATFMPISIVAFEWVGKTPQEDSDGGTT